MIWNIIDRPERPHLWKRINAIIEPTWHDNSCRDSDQADEGPDDPCYEKREDVMLAEAVTWASAKPSAVTLYLYDEGDGVGPLYTTEAVKFIMEEDNTTAFVAQAVRDRREQLGLTLQALASKSGVSSSRISDIEHGTKSPAISTVALLAKALGVPLFALIDTAL